MTTIKKRNSLFTIAGLVVFFLLCLVPNGQAQSCVPVSQGSSPPWQLGVKCIFTSASGATGLGNVAGLNYFQIFFVPTGTVSGATLSLDSSPTGIASSWTIGGMISSGTIGAMTSAGSYANSSAITPTAYGQLTPTITGTGNVTVTIFGYVNSPSASGGGGGGSVTVTNFPTTQAVSGTVSNQPAGFGSSPLGNQVAVTASAVALASNSTHLVCITALIANTIPVYVGGSGVTTSTGYPLNAGDFYCWSVSNSNLLFLIASTTGASIAWTAL
jgi:hypothetical protein